MQHTVTTHSSEETVRLGSGLGKNAVEGMVIALTGDLGSGKTAFTQGVAEGIGITGEYIVSPTYTLINHYPGDGCPSLYHVDLYRLSDMVETEDLGLDEVLHQKGVVVIEWAEKFGPHFWGEDVEVRFAVTGVTDREIVLISHGPKGDEIVNALLTDKEFVFKEGT
jgi:tRNA threonylcarbamoyladenosine biosynthesis protein TsaE